MNQPKLIRITTIPLSLDKLLEGQLPFMQNYFDVTGICANKEKLEALGKKHGYATHHVEMTRQITPFADLKAVYKLYKYLRKEKPTIVHTHTPKAGIVGMLAAKLAGVPVRLHTVAGLPLMEAKGLKRLILNNVEKSTYACATQVYPNSKGLSDFIIREKLAPLEKIKIIGRGGSNGIDTSYFDPELYKVKQKTNLREKLNIAKDDFVFVFVGRLVKDKGINELVTAFKNLNSSAAAHHSKLLLVGPFEAELSPLDHETIAEIQQNPHIISVGYQHDVRPYMAAANALVFPSYREGFPNVVMQTGAMGLPAIVSDINGCNEIIKEEENGLLVPSKDAETLQIAMRRFLEDKELYNKLKRSSRRLIVSRYQREEVWRALLDEYKEVMERRHIPEMITESLNL